MNKEKNNISKVARISGQRFLECKVILRINQRKTLKKISFIFLIMLIFIKSENLTYGNKKDSLLNIINTQTYQDTIRVKAMNEYTLMLYNIQPDSALYFSKEALRIATKENFEIGIVVSHDRLARYYWMTGEFSLALESLFEKLKILKKQNDKKKIASTYGNIGLIYSRISDNENALFYYNKYLKIAEEIDNKHFQATVHGNIGVIYAEMFDNEKTAGNSNIDSLFNKAMYHYITALKFSEETENLKGISTDFHRIANLYTYNNQYDIALDYYTKSLQIAQKINDKGNMAILHGNLGQLYIKIGKLNFAEPHLDSALFIDQFLNQKDHAKQVYFDLSILNEQKGNYQKALQNFKEYTLLKDSIFNESKSKEIGKLEATYEIEKKQAEEERYKQEQERIEQAEKERRDNIQYSLIFLGILLVFGSVLGLGYIKVSTKFAEGLIFFAFLIFFEFCLVLLDPIIDNWSSGEPIYKLLFNALLAGAIFPAHAFFENKLKKKLVK
jgi:tetratricopeptide (TPR) repeat protein